MGLRSAINDKCKDCIYDPCAGGSWREQVTMCSAIDCPLWSVRPRISARASKKQVAKLVLRMERASVDQSLIRSCLGKNFSQFDLI